MKRKMTNKEMYAKYRMADRRYMKRHKLGKYYISLHHEILYIKLKDK